MRQLAPEPCTRRAQIMANHMNRLAHHQRDLLGRESTKVIQFHDPGEFRVARGELFKGEIEIEQGGGVAGRGGRVVALAIEGERSAATALRGGPRAGIVHKHLPHDPRHQSEEVHPVGEARYRRAEMRRAARDSTLNHFSRANRDRRRKPY